MRRKMVGPALSDLSPRTQSPTQSLPVDGVLRMISLSMVSQSTTTALVRR